MVIRSIQLHLVFVFGDFAEPIHVGGIKPAAVNPNPTFGSNPFGSPSDVRMPTRNDHRHVIGVLASNPVLGTGIPQRIAWWEFPVALHEFRAASLVAIKTPVRNVAMMANPI